MKQLQTLLSKIKNKSAKFGIVGTGYVGYTLGLAAAKAGFSVIGYDTQEDKAERIKGLQQKDFIGTTDKSKLRDCDIISICVPTPINEKHKPDLQPLISAAESLYPELHEGVLITLESTVAPGTSREILRPILEKSGLKVGDDLSLGFSPHRVDFGNPNYTLESIPKVMGGFDEDSLEAIKTFYSAFIKKIVPVSSLEAAEMTKILENSFRFMNIIFINEIAEYCTKRKIPVREVVDAAATKPFGFMAHYPTAGISGHCIPVDPYYLVEDGKKFDYSFPMLNEAFHFHEEHLMKGVKKIEEVLGSLKGKKILIVGVAIKPGSDDARESAGGRIMDALEAKGAITLYSDAHIPHFEEQKSQEIQPELLKSCDAIVLVTYHSDINYQMLIDSGIPLFDTGYDIPVDMPHIYRI